MPVMKKNVVAILRVPAVIAARRLLAGALLFSRWLAVADPAGAQPLISGIRPGPNGRVVIEFDPLGATGGVFEIYRTDAAACGAAPAVRNWRLAGENIRPRSASCAIWTGTVDSAGVQLFRVGRADIDRDENGIADARQALLPVQDLPAGARAKWARAGIAGAFSNYPAVANVRTFGARGNGADDDTAAIHNAINSLPGGGVVYLPTGTYRITQPLYLKSGMILRGDGAAATRLHFEGAGTAGRCIAIARWDSEQTFGPQAVTGGLAQGSTVLALANITGFAAGDIVELDQDNEPDWNLNEAWQARLPGQIFRVVAVDTARRQLALDRPLRIAFNPCRNPRLRKLAVMRGSGIEDLYVARQDAVDGHTIEFKYAVNCWVRRVESDRAYKAHVWMERSYECEIRESYFHHAHVYGGGGQGYGAACGRHTSDCLIEDNQFSHLRHSMSVGSGASGNVFAYNFSTNRALDPVSGQPQADISIHGNYVFMNLFEGNVVEDADVPDWYWPAGPGNTLFRNRIVNRTTAVDVSSDGQNIVGNELPRGAIKATAGLAHVVTHGNVELGTVTWSNTLCQALPPSYYTCVQPPFFPNNDPELAWPPIGPDHLGHLTADEIPAQRRFQRGEL